MPAPLDTRPHLLPHRPGEQPTTLPIVVGITGASGSIIGFQFIKTAIELGIPVELVMTEKSLQVIFDELQVKISGATEAEKAQTVLNHIGLPEHMGMLNVYGNHRLDAPPSSGTHLTRGMVIIPCSMGTLGRLAAGIGDNLVARSADVTLKEGRPLVVVPRETPLNMIHLRNMMTLKEAGAHIVPPMLTFYLPEYENMQGQINYVIGKVLDVMHIPHTLYTRWGNQ